MYVDIVPNRSSPPAILLRESRRDGKRVVKRTAANLTNLLTLEEAKVLKRVMAGEKMVGASEALSILSSKPHGHVLAVKLAMQRLGIAGLLASKRSRERELVLALVAARVIKPATKLATWRTWRDSSLASEFGVEDASVNDIYAAMDWLVKGKERIEKKLVARHLSDGALVLFDLTSTYVEGEKCDLAAFGYSRDRKRGKRQVNWGLLTDAAGRPVALDVFTGNTSDSSTLLPQVKRVRERFGIERFTIVGDRGMITNPHIKALKEQGGIDWVSALKSSSIKPLVAEGVIQPSLFDETDMLEFTHASYPGERLIACRNPLLAAKRAHVRSALLEKTLTELAKVKARVIKGDLVDAGKIGEAVGRVTAKHKMRKHLTITINEGNLEYEIDDENVKSEALLDGIYIIRTSVNREELDAAGAVRAYKALTNVERDYRVSKSDLNVRPLHHRLSDRVVAHLFICLLAAYVRWYMERAWASLTFKDERKTHLRNPVAKAQRSYTAERKTRTRCLPDNTATHSFKTLLEHLETLALNTCTALTSEAEFTMTTTPTTKQQQALDLIKTIEL